MRKLVLLLASTALAIVGYAQPSDAEITKMLKGKGALEVRFTSEKGHIYTELNQKYFLRTAESKWKSDFEGVYTWSRSDYRYDYAGGKWVFNKSLFSDSWYEGLDNPTEAEILEHLSKDWEAVLGMDYRHGVGKFPTIKLSDEPKYQWHNPNSVSFNIVYDFTLGDNIQSKYRQVHRVLRVRLYRDDGTGKHDPNIKKVLKTDWLPAHVSSDQSHLSKEGPWQDVKEDEVIITFADQKSGVTEQQLLAEKTKYNQFKVGDRITGKFRGQYHHGKIEEIKTHNKGKTVIIRFDDVGSRWYGSDVEDLTLYDPSKVAKNIIKNPVQGSNNQGNQSGSDVKDKLNKGKDLWNKFKK